MAYTSDKKPGALTQATALGDNDNVVIEQAGAVKRATLTQIEAKVLEAKTAITTPTGTENVIVRRTDNTLRQVALSNIVPALNITNARISESAAIDDTKLATIATAGKVLNSATTATPDNTNNAIVSRDGSGNFSAGTITATLAGSITGNAATANTATTATTLVNGRTIALTGDVTGTTGAFNGSANVSAATTIANDAVTSLKILDGAVTTSKIASGNVTLDRLVSAVQQMLVPVGAVQAFAMNSAPGGWLACNGSAVSRSTYATLFAAIGITYGGGDGINTFNLPDLRGYFLRGSGTNGDGTAAGAFGEKVEDSFKTHNHSASSNSTGAHNHSASSNSTGAHTHSASTNTTGAHTHRSGLLLAGTETAIYNTTTTDTQGNATRRLEQTSSSMGSANRQAITHSNGDHSHSVTVNSGGAHSHTITVNSDGAHSHTITVADTGSAETRPKNIAMLYCIKF